MSIMFGRKKYSDEKEHEPEIVVEADQPGHEVMILVTDEDKTGSDVMKMSDFFSIALQGMSKELVSSETLITVDDLPLSDLGIINEAIQAVGVFRSPEFDLVPDFSSLPKDIQDKYKAGELILGESKQVEGNIRSVLVDAETKVRVKDVTLKKVEHTDASTEISRNMLNQMQLSSAERYL